MAKKRISGLYLSQETVKAIEELRAGRRPVPSFNRQVVQLVEYALNCLLPKRRAK